ncbi:MAG: PAC2 family protein [Candidatus Nanohaloarchaea archaeon]|nr:PAC2 family protein [Candidatus Nanohaloarchaea archaeon]
MATINVVNDTDISGFHFIDGFPGVGIVAKIASDFIIDKLDMELYAEVHSNDLPPVALFHSDSRDITPVMRLFVDEENEIVAMRSGTPISAASEHFLEELLDWIEENNLTPIYQAGLPLDVD